MTAALRRDLDRLVDERFDVLVIGGGILGAFVAWDASSRGYRTALLEKDDFGGGTSWNSLKIIHGGLRYLRHLDLRRARESIRERSTWLRIAPHLVEPLPVALGTYRRSLQNRGTLWAAMAVSDAVGWDRNRRLPADRRLPRGRLLSASEARRRLPELGRPDLTGAALFHDAQMYSSERLVLEVLEAAALEGAALANYVRFEEGLGRGSELGGARATDLESGESLDVRSRVVVNAAGPDSRGVAARLTGSPSTRVPRYSLGLNLVVDPFDHEVAFGLPLVPEGRRRQEVPPAGTRQLFFVPWRDRTLIGTGHFPLPAPGSGTGRRGSPALPDLDPFVDAFLATVNRSLPLRTLDRSDVRLVHAGLLPVDPDGAGGAVAGEDGSPVPLLRRRQVIDHARQGTPGALTGLSVKFTTSRLLAQEIVDRVAGRLGEASGGCRTAETPLPGARRGTVGEARREARRRWGDEVPEEVLEHLVRTYGWRAGDVLAAVREDPGRGQRVASDSPVVVGQMIRGVEREMARRPEDLLYRRTELGAVGSAGTDRCRAVARRVMDGQASTDCVPPGEGEAG